MAKQKNPKAKEYPARIAFLTTDEQAARLRAHSKVTGVPTATIIRRALDAALPKASKPARKVAEPATEVPSTTVAPF
jgi:hypothetical protein